MFMGLAEKAGIVDMCVHYESVLVGKCAFTATSPQIEHSDRALRSTLEAQSTAVRHQKLDARVILEKNPYSENDCDVNPIMISIKQMTDRIRENTRAIKVNHSVRQSEELPQF
jgi:hypothetical protein